MTNEDAYRFQMYQQANRACREAYRKKSKKLPQLEAEAERLRLLWLEVADESIDTLVPSAVFTAQIPN